MRERFCSAADAVACVASGQTVGLMHACGEPQALVEALVGRAVDLRGVRLLTSWHGVSPAPYAAEEYAASFAPLTAMPARTTRAAVAAGRGEYLPLSFGAFACAIRDGQVPVDVAFVQVSPPFGDGLCSLGVSVDYAREMLAVAPMCVAQVNDQMPAYGGQALVPFEDFDFVVEDSRPLLELPVPQQTAVTEAIGRAAAALVEDGATIQIGIGAIPNAVLAAFGDHKNLGVHSGMLSDGLLDLYDAGVITNARKSVDPGWMVVGSIIGSRELFERARLCRHLAMQSATYTHNVEIIKRQEHFVAINSAVEVDLGGNVNAEVADGLRISGPGGQPEFALGGSQAENGQVLVCLPSTAKDDTVSRIVARLDAQVPVTTPGGHVTAVVTEYGAADLRGLDTRARAEAIAAIAHPTFREDLLRAAAEYA